MATVESDDLVRASANPAAVGVATIEELEATLASGQRDAAADLVERFYREARDHYLSYSGKWHRRLPRWMLGQGVAAAELDRLRTDWIARCSPTDAPPIDRSAYWRSIRTRCARLAAGLRAGDLTATPAQTRADTIWRDWLTLHDFCVDYIRTSLRFVVGRFGERALEDALRAVLAGRVWPDLPADEVAVGIAFSMRGHLAGPGRRGSLGVTRGADGWTLRFDPCGSGGRLMRAAQDSGDTSMLLTERHDFAWNTPGICHYCAHCCLGLTRMPIEARGRPVVSINPPRFDLETGELIRDYCEFTVHTDVAPDEVFAAVGLPPMPQPPR